ncbi:MAG: hypothetical protein NTV54_08965 [Ignavibacteriales bacterium]|nr:hypothetical protein [Ignavibacteriales bacterium]
MCYFRPRDILCCLLAAFIAAPVVANAQSIDTAFSTYGRLIRAALSTAPFPHPKRADGHKYRDSLYSAADHYRDSSVAIFVPKGFRRSLTTDFVVYFHGWFNNIDSVLRQYRLIEQFMDSKKNAILVIPEGPRNAPNSYGGKLEDENGFKKFMTDVVKVLVKTKIVRSKQVGRIILAGHSGGYNVMSYIVLRGGMNAHIKELYLFDAWYGQTEKFTYWLDHFKGRIVNIYTEQGGTKWETEAVMEDLDGWHIPYAATEDTLVTQRLFHRNRLLFLHTDLTHNNVVSVRNAFRDYLSSSVLTNRVIDRRK